jgi:hypothetical protein
MSSFFKKANREHLRACDRFIFFILATNKPLNDI